MAHAYTEAIGHDGGSFFQRFLPFLRRHLPDFDGAKVLDVGCGHGWLSAYLAAQGAVPYGIDGSAALIASARQHYPALGFEVADLTEPLEAGSDYDAAVAHMVLMDLPVLDPVMRTVASSLRPGGTFLFTILHPAFFNYRPSRPHDPQPWHRAVTDYLTVQQWRIESFGGHWHYHRPLQDYVTALAGVGLSVIGLDEPATPPEHRRAASQWTDHERWFATLPTMLSIAAVRAG